MICSTKKGRRRASLNSNLMCCALEKSYRLDAGNLEAFAAAHIFAGQQIVLAHHVALRLGELCPVALVGPGRQRLFLHAHNPAHFIFALLPAMWAGQHVLLCLLFFVVKIPFVHDAYYRPVFSAPTPTCGTFTNLVPDREPPAAMVFCIPSQRHISPLVKSLSFPVAVLSSVLSVAFQGTLLLGIASKLKLRALGRIVLAVC
jgi:hypothetical protein